MSTVSKEILDKLRQLSDLLVVIKDSSNNTPQILKELAVEKCSEIYSALSSEEDIIEYKIVETSNEEKIEEPAIKEEPTEFAFNEEDVNEEPLCKAPVECDVEEEEGIEKNCRLEEQTFPIEDSEPEEDEEINPEPETIEEEITIEKDTESYEDEVAEDDDFEVEEEKIEEEDEKDITIDIEADLFSSKESYKKCCHKKIRSVLSINDIFLYKRELFGNSDVDMTDMFDGIDEAESLEDAMELINEYFGSDVDSEEMVIEFVERVKQCFE